MFLVNKYKTVVVLFCISFYTKVGMLYYGGVYAGGIHMDYFNLKFHNTTVRNEIFAGMAMFMAMSYILVVCPTVLSGIGMNYNGVFLATVCVSGFTTIVSALYTKLPIAFAPGLGITGMFVGLATGENPLHWSVLLLATYVAGIIICAFVRFGIFDAIMCIMDEEFRRMLMSGIGLALLLYGISTTGLIVKENSVYQLGEIQVVPVLICIISILVMYILKRKNRKGYVFLGLIVAYILSLVAGGLEAYRNEVVTFPEYMRQIMDFSYDMEDVQKVMLSFPDVIQLFSDKKTTILFVNAVFVFTMGHFFDAIGTNTSSFDAINSDIDFRMKDTVSLKRAITVDGVGNIASGLVGTPSVTAYGESLVGIVSGGKTGITAITTGCLFLLCAFFSPLFTSMATYVAAPALIYVGFTLLVRYREFDRKRTVLFLFGIVLILYAGITFNIGNTVLYGLLVYTFIKTVVMRQKPVAHWWIIPLFVVIHILLNLV